MKLNFSMMPQSGFILAYFRTKVVFEEYKIENNEIHFKSADLLKTDTLSECHCFDEKTEYRIIYKHDGKETVELCLTQDEEAALDCHLVREELWYIKPEYRSNANELERLRVVTRYHYTENDSLCMTNSRMAGVVRS